MKTSTKVAIGIFAGLAAWLIYRMLFSYHTAGSPLATTASNLQNPGTSTATLQTDNSQTLPPSVPVATGPASESRLGRGHF